MWKLPYWSILLNIICRLQWLFRVSGREWSSPHTHIPRSFHWRCFRRKLGPSIDRTCWPYGSISFALLKEIWILHWQLVEQMGIVKCGLDSLCSVQFYPYLFHSWFLLGHGEMLETPFCPAEERDAISIWGICPLTSVWSRRSKQLY